jgi:hypothetical protein
VGWLGDRKSVSAFLIFAGMVALIVGFKFLAH